MGMLDPQQLHTMKARPGFIAALDQSGGSTPGALRAYGIKDGAWSSEDEMFQSTDLFTENLRRYLAGAPLLNLVDRATGY